MIEPPVVVCDMCGQRQAYSAPRGFFEFPEDWRKRRHKDFRYHICPENACMKLFLKQCEEKR